MLLWLMGWPKLASCYNPRIPIHKLKRVVVVVLLLLLRVAFAVVVVVVLVVVDVAGGDAEPLESDV